MKVQFFVATILLIAVTGRQCPPKCHHGFWPHCLGGQICYGCKLVDCKSEYVQNN
jgi:hypothetical protein